MFSHLMHEHEGEDRVWRATWAMPSGYQLHTTLDIGMTERIKRLEAAGLRKPLTPLEQLMHTPSPWDVDWHLPDPPADLSNGVSWWPVWMRQWWLILVGEPRW